MKNKDVLGLLTKVAKSISNSDKLSVPFLVAKALNYSKSMPHDKTVGSLAIILSKLSDNNKGFITKAEFKNLFDKSYVNGTKAKEVFASELDSQELTQEEVEKMFPEAYSALPEPYQNDSCLDFMFDEGMLFAYPKHDQHDALGHWEAVYVPKSKTWDVEHLSKGAFSSSKPELKIEAGDDLLTTSLKDIFSGNPVRNYSESIANKALSKVSKSLDMWGMIPSKLFVGAGNSKYLVIQADYETPKGVTSVHIPVESIDNEIIESSVFIGNGTPSELNNSNLKNYILTNAGNKLALTAGMLLNALDKFVSKSEISNAEMALIRLNAKKNAHTEHAASGITGLTLDSEPVKDVQEMQFEESKSFAEKFASAYGEASLKFGSDKIKLSRDVIVRELKACGYKNPQLRLNKVSDNTLYYAVSLSTVAFTTPIKIENGLVQLPTILISNGTVKPFNADSIKSLYKENVDCKAAAIASPLYNLKASDLMETIRQAVSDKNLEKAEDALNVLASVGTGLDYAKALRLFMNQLSIKEAKKETSCSRMLKTSSSKHPVCGHTGLPLDKVYQDQHGNCRPKYRQAMNDTFEGVLSMDSKVFI